MTKITTKNNVSHVERAKIIQKTLGTFTAARYLEKREWSIDAALFILCGK